MSASPDSRASEPLLLEVERFEHISDGSERVLLRIDGRYEERPGKRVLDAMLYVDDGLAIYRHDPLPDPGGELDSWLWRAAFDVPASYLTDARTRFALESQPGTLLDLARPGEIARSVPSIPVSVRAAHTARRYAAAVAVLLTVAVTPGGLPATAQTTVLKVRQPNGAIVYMTTDGRQLAQLPPDAVVVDQTGDTQAPSNDQPAPAPQQQPAPTPPLPQPAPGPQQPAPAPQPQAPPATATTVQTQTAQPTTEHTKTPAKRRGRKPKPRKRVDLGTHARRKPHRHKRQQQHQQAEAPQRHGRDHRHHPHPGPAPSTQAPPARPPADPQPLSSQPQLIATHQSGGDQLRPLARIQVPAQSAARPVAQDLPAPALGPLPDTGTGGPALGTTTDAAAPAPPLDPPALFSTSPDPTAAPPLLDPPSAHGGDRQHHSGSHAPAPEPKPQHHSAPQHHAAPQPHAAPHPAAPHTVANSAPSPTNLANTPPLQSLGTPPSVTGVPNFVIDQFHVPPFLLPIYQAAGMQYGIRWEVLAAINEIETDYGRNLSVSSAGAIGWMQFMPSTWATWGVDANRDHKRDPYNPVDAIFAAARYLKAAGGDKNIRQAIFAYNHATWYVDSVMLRARLLAGYPPDFIDSLSGLTEARFPVAAKAQYGETAAAKAKQVKAGQNATNVVAGSDTKHSIDVYAHAGAPVVAVNDGVIKDIGHSKTQGNYLVLQDVYGNQFTYSHLGSLAKLYPVPKPEQPAKAGKQAKSAAAGSDPKPSAPATAGAQKPEAEGKAKNARGQAPQASAPAATPAPQPAAPIVKQRLFAHPARPNSSSAGGFEQLLASGHGGFETYDNYFSRSLGLNSKNAQLKKLKKGSQVVASTVLGRIGAAAQGQKPHLKFEIRPAGKGAPKIDPQPILDGWKLLESTAIYRADGRNALYKDGSLSFGQAMLLPKPMLEKRVLSDPRIQIYAAGRDDIRTGQIDRRVLLVLEYLADSGLHPTVSCLKSGHSLMTTSGNVSEHSSGDAVDISAINDTPILGHQKPGGITEIAVKRLMQLQGTMQPHQIISLLDFGQNTLSLPDHYNHIHVGFHPMFGDNAKLGQEVRSVLKPGQWGKLVARLGQIQNPAVPTHPSKYALPDNPGGR